jgi:hypothetical protein
MVADRVLRNLAGYGPLEPLLADDDVWEVMVNAPDATFAEPSVSSEGAEVPDAPDAPEGRGRRRPPSLGTRRLHVVRTRLSAASAPEYA